MAIKIINTSREVFDYIYYRITRFYLTRDSSRIKFYSTQNGGIIVFGLLAFLFSAVVLCPLSSIVKVDLLGYKLFWWKWNTPFTWIVISFCVFGKYYGSKSRYQALCERYDNEPHSTLKGWGIVALIISIFVIYGISAWLFVRPLHFE